MEKKSACTLASRSSFPLATVKKGGRANSRRLSLPAPILVILFLSGGRSGAGEGDGSSNRRVAVYRLGRFLPRPRFSSSSAVDGGVRVCSSAVAGDASSAAGDASRRRQIKVPVGGLVSGRISGLLDFFLQRVGVFAPLPLLVDAAAAVVFGDGGLRFVLVLLLGKEWDLLCTSVSFPFWVGNCIAGCGIASFFFAVVACWFFVCLRVDLGDYGAAEEGGGGAKAEVPTAGFSSRGWFAASQCVESALCFGFGKVGGWVSRRDARCAAEARRCRQWRKTNSVSWGLFVIFVTFRGLSARKDVLCLILS